VVPSRAGRRRVFGAVFVSVLAVGLFASGSIRADEPPGGWFTGSYSRDVFRPVDHAYSWANIQGMVEAIRAEGHAIPTGHPRIFITPGNRAALADNIESSLSAFMQQTVDLADQYYGVVIDDPGGHSDEPDAQPVIIACGIIYQLGEIAGVTYSHTPLEYGQSGVDHLVHMAGMDTYYRHRTFLGLPLGYDWLYDLMTQEQRETVAATMMSYVPLEDDHVDPYNNMYGVRLMGPLAILGDGIDDEGARDALDMFSDGLVIGEPTNQGLSGVGCSSCTNVSSLHMWVPEGPGPEGLGYSMWNAPFYFFLEAWYDQTGEDYFKLPFFQSWPFYYTYAAGNEYEHEDKYAKLQDRAWEHGAYGVNQLLEPSLARSNPVAASLARWHHWVPSQGYADGSTTPGMFYMLRFDPTVIARSPIELDMPTTGHFKMADHVFGRNSWSGVDTTWVYFEAPTWTSIRNLGPVNDINIWKHGGFLLTKRTMGHDYDGLNRTNTLVVYDFDNFPGDTLIPQNVMDRSANRSTGIAPGTPMSKITKAVRSYTGGLRYFDERPGEYLYAFGDGERSIYRTVDYVVTYPLDNWDRQFVWFRAPSNADTDHFVVFDRIDKVGPSETEHLMFNFNMAPDIRDRSTNDDLGEGTTERPGIYRYEGADRIVATKRAGRFSTPCCRRTPCTTGWAGWSTEWSTSSAATTAAPRGPRTIRRTSLTGCGGSRSPVRATPRCSTICTRSRRWTTASTTPNQRDFYREPVWWVLAPVRTSRSLEWANRRWSTVR